MAICAGTVSTCGFTRRPLKPTGPGLLVDAPGIHALLEIKDNAAETCEKDGQADTDPTVHESKKDTHTALRSARDLH